MIPAVRLQNQITFSWWQCYIAQTFKTRLKWSISRSSGRAFSNLPAARTAFRKVPSNPFEHFAEGSLYVRSSSKSFDGQCWIPRSTFLFCLHFHPLSKQGCSSQQENVEVKQMLLKADWHYLLIHIVLILSAEHWCDLSKNKIKANESATKFRFLGQSVML